MNFDLVVIGGGVGGYSGAIRAAKRGMSVALVEEQDLGGTCLNRGCVPVKTLLHSAEIFSERSEWEELGIIAENVSFDEEKIYDRKRAVCARLRDGVELLVKANKITLFRSHGKLLNRNTVSVGEEVLHTKFILLATGSVPQKLNLKGIEHTLNSDDVLEKPVNAKHIAIIGGGVIGVELATYFSNLSREVTIIEAEERILPMVSRELSTQLSASLKRSGVKLLTLAKVSEISYYLTDEKNPNTGNQTGKRVVSVQTAKGEIKIDCDAVVVAVGRSCNLLDLGLESANVDYARFVKVDDNMRTNVDNIYACGDIVGRAQLAHFASASAIVAVESMLGEKPSIDLRVVPSCVYTSPQIAVVGRTELNEGDKQGKFMMGANGKSIIQGGKRGYVKIIANENDIIVGAEIFAINGTEIIGELALAIKNQMKVHEVSSTIHAHPTVMEAVGEACEDIFGLATHKV